MPLLLIGYPVACVNPPPPVPPVPPVQEAPPSVEVAHGVPVMTGEGPDHRLDGVDSLLSVGITTRVFPGAAVVVGQGDRILKMQGYGHFTYESAAPTTPQSRFDLASLTKVVATTTVAMLLYEQGRLDLDAPVVRYLPAFGQKGKEHVTIRHLLTHSAGFIPFRPFHQLGLTTRAQVIDAILQEELQYPPGTQSRYSDFSMITLALVLEQITGQDLATSARQMVFEPLGMTQTGFRRAGEPDATIVPTEYDQGFRKRLIQGEVHDETAWILGGTSGHAGLFSTAEDLSRFALMMVHEGRVGDRVFLKPETIRLFTTRVSPDPERTRALGWDTRSPENSSAGQYFGPRSYGHTGFTGTSIWIDPEAKLFVILLSNRVYPTRDNPRIVSLRPQLADLVYQALVPTR